MDILCSLLNLYIIAIIVRLVLSWFPLSPGSVMERVNYGLRRVTDPVLEPLRRVLPPLGPIDISPMIAIIGLQLVVGRLILGC
ncbi:MAG: YggT family protein [Acidimicrobiia bacterium]